MKDIIAIVGPTAVGKTAVGIEVAKRLNTEIVSADSVQIFKGLNIGSAKVTEAEQCGVVHHMLDCVPADARYSVHDYAQAATRIIDGLQGRKRVPVVVGGTGLYLNALMYEMDCGNVHEAPEYRQSLEALAAEKGPMVVYERLRARDPEAAQAIHPNNVKRVIRALERIQVQGGTWQSLSAAPKGPYAVHVFVLTRDRQETYRRIEARVETMLEQGLIQEVQGLLDQGVSPKAQSMQAIGYKEVVAYLRACTALPGQDVTRREALYAEMVATLKINSRRYAKRQWTWFKRYACAQWVNVDDLDTQGAARLILEGFNQNVTYNP